MIADEPPHARSAPPEDPLGGRPIATEGKAAVAALFEAHFSFIWRFVRRIGVPPQSVDDAAQQVFLVATQKIDVIDSAKARSFLIGTALRIASEMRRARLRSPEIATAELDSEASESLSPEQLTEAKRELEALDRVLNDMPFELRAVFVLFEIEGLSTDEIAPVLGLRRGTVSSRLRRAREAFQAICGRIQSKRTFAEQRRRKL